MGLGDAVQKISTYAPLRSKSCHDVENMREFCQPIRVTKSDEMGKTFGVPWDWEQP